MPRRIAFTFLLLAVGIVIGVMLRPNIAADPPKEEKKEKPIPIDEVRKRGILGDLGHPLGTIVTVEGEAADDYYRKRKADSGHTLLRVKSVNGTELKEEVVFRFDGKKEDAPKVAAKFKYVGYESACYHGIVDGQFKYTGPIANVGFWFHGDFNILKDELKPEKK
jgi:hypothetical protein